jgi:TolB protein
MLCAASATALAASDAAAQDTTKAPAGIALTGRYTAKDRPGVAVRPFGGAGAAQSIVDTIGRIVLRDVAYSDRYEMVPTPVSLASGAIDYKGWVSLNTSYLVTGDVVPTGTGYELAITVHDVVYARVKDAKRYRLPPMTNATVGDFRMAVHAVSDDIVRSLSNQPGHAATRIVFERQNKATSANGTGSYDLLIVDSDGFGMRRLTGGTGQILSPVWSPDGRKLLYVLNGSQLIERDVASGSTRVLRTEAGMQTPAYSPDGQHVAYSAWVDSAARLYDLDLSRMTVRRLSAVKAIEISPTYSGDGSRIAFMSNRFGLPHIFVMPSSGSAGSLISPYVQGMKGYYFGPDFSPTSSQIVFAGHWNSQGVFQIMLGDADRPGAQVRQLTNDGDNEDPSWAPDGRHIVYSSGVGEQQLSLYVIDTVTLTKRRLVDGGKLRMSDWSPVLARAADIQVR